jgi:hypothetical protein
MLVAAAAAAVSAPGDATAYTDTYCGARLTPAHGSCWASDVGIGNHSWTRAYATYTGGGAIRVCAAIDYWPHLSPTLASRCDDNKPVGPDAFISYCGADWRVADKDAGVGNASDRRHTIRGEASTGGC